MTRVDSAKLCSDGRVAGKGLCRAGITTVPGDFEWPVRDCPINSLPDRGPEMKSIVVSEKVGQGVGGILCWRIVGDRINSKDQTEWVSETQWVIFYIRIAIPTLRVAGVGGV